MPGLLRRILSGSWRWSWRLIPLVAVANLGWDLWSWQDRTYAEDARKFWRAAEQPDDTARGLAEIRIVNETGRDWLIDSLVLDGRGSPEMPRRTLSRAGEPGATREAERDLDRLVSSGRLILRDGASGPTRLVTFQVDRRSPTSCRIEVLIREDGDAVSECEMLPRIRYDFRWLFGPPDY